MFKRVPKNTNVLKLRLESKTKTLHYKNVPRGSPYWKILTEFSIFEVICLIIIKEVEPFKVSITFIGS